jgi:acyl-homoserine lactone acylase PvdQ
MKGPIKINEKQYADYDVGVFNDASFSQQERSAYKQVMGRVTINPFGANSRYDGLGLTGFYDYGYSRNCTPDVNKTNATCAHIARAAALAYYTAATWGIIAEWDYGHNAFANNNLFSGSAPSDFVGIASNRDGTAGRNFAGWNKMVGGILNTQAVQMGADLLGHFDIPHTPFTAFGLLQWFEPNTRISKNPLDFTRYDVGVQWLVNKYFRVAFDSQAIQYYHSQFTFEGGQLGRKSVDVPFAVARDTHGFFLNMEFRY